MFTGIIQNLGIVESLRDQEGGLLLGVRLSAPLDLQRGESVAINGVCLTVIPETATEATNVHPAGGGLPRSSRFLADLSRETLDRTSLGSLREGQKVNLERALTLADRLGGHLVQGHVDAVGRLIERREGGRFATLRWSYPPAGRDLVVDKGSIAVDGVSLTIVEPSENDFGAALVPETLQQTTLTSLAIGDGVNLEFDMMAKFVQKILAPYVERMRKA